MSKKRNSSRRHGGHGAKAEIAPRSPRRRGESLRRGLSRGVTLVELLITMAIVVVMSGILYSGLMSLDGTRLKGSAMVISSAIRVAYAHANATSKVARLVFDFEQRTIILEESSTKLLLAKNEVSGGAEAATDAERKAQAEAEQLAKGPVPPRPRFTPTKQYGFGNKASPGKPLESGIRFLQIETAHDEMPETVGRSYLYFWPGGQTEHAAIQLLKGGATLTPVDKDVMTILVSPLTGKTTIKWGRVPMPRPRDDISESERIDTAVF